MKNMQKILFLLFFFVQALAAKDNLKVLTINVWSGLDYEGRKKFGDLESPEQREKRFHILLSQLKELNPDVIYLQEANPADEYSSRLADSLLMDEIHFTCNSGIKFFGWGIPSNLNEGIAILAKKELKLEKYNVLKLKGASGIYGDNFSMHFNESHFALVGKISFNHYPVYLINTHLLSSPPVSSKLFSEFSAFVLEKGNPKSLLDEISKKVTEATTVRSSEISKLIDFTEDFPPKTLIILGGDLNTSPNSSEIKRLTDSLYIDTSPQNDFYTWNSKLNENIRISNPELWKEGRFDYLSYDYFTAQSNQKLDYIFINTDCFKKTDVISSEIVLNKSEGGLFPSDHFGLMSEISFRNLEGKTEKVYDRITLYGKQHAEPLPIASYDFDVGLGLGVKLFLKNQMKRNESFDLIMFGSTKGEVWGRFVFSIPDFSIRQGKIYPLAFDLIFDYDRYLKNNFFGVGNKSKWGDREYYTKEPLEISLNFSRGFSKTLVATAGTKYMFVRNYNIGDSSAIRNISPSLNTSRIDFASLYAGCAYDTRDNYLHPTKGIVAKANLEYAPDFGIGNISFGKAGLTFQNYLNLFYPNTILATRILFQSLIGENLPIQVLLPIGGNRTVRGIPQDRYLDRVSAVANAELRFPIYWRFGGIVGYDAGKVWNSPEKIDMKNWVYSSTVGLRCYFNTFIIRADFGFSRETMCMYLNFDHIF